MTAADHDAFAASRAGFEALAAWLGGAEVDGLEHAELEHRLTSDGRDLLRQLLQDHLDLRASRERRSDVIDADGDAHTRVLDIERAHLHPVPDAAYSAAFGQSRSVGWSATVSFRGARYSVPHTLAGTTVWVRASVDEVVIVSGEGSGVTEVARHLLVGPGQASICDEHYPARRRNPAQRQPRPTKPSEAAFCDLGEGAKLYLVEAAAAGVRRIEARMAEAVALAALHGADVVDRGLGTAAMAGRFADGDAVRPLFLYRPSLPPLSSRLPAPLLRPTGAGHAGAALRSFIASFAK